MSHTWGPDHIVHVDRDHDTRNASDGYSRYGSYVGARELSFQDPWAQPKKEPLAAASFALAAWHVATREVSSPPLVNLRPDIRNVALGFDEEGEHLAAVVELPLTHRQLAAKIPHAYADWNPYSGWTPGDDGYAHLSTPSARPGRPAVSALVTVRHVLSSLTLVTPGTPTGRPLVDDALASVERTAAAINAELPEIIRTVQGGS